MLRRTTQALLPVALLGGALYLAAAEEATDNKAMNDNIKRVRVAAVESTSEHRTLTFSGVTRAARRADVAFTLGGRLETRPVEIGDTIRKGQVLASLDARQHENAAASAQAQLAELEARQAQAARDLARVRALSDAKAATSEELEQTEARLTSMNASVEAAKAQVADARRRLDETRLTAPFDAVITEVFFEPGEWVSSGRSVLLLSGAGDIELEVEVPEATVLYLDRERDLEVRFPALDRSARARITSLGRTAPGPGQLFPVVARILGDEAPSLPGLTAELVLDLTDDAALSVPVEAVINPGGRQPSVFRLRETDGETRVERVAVDVGNLLEDAVVVRGSLAAGDRVVVGGQRGLLDGEPVAVLEGER